MGSWFSKNPQVDILEAVESLQKEKDLPVDTVDMKKDFDDIYQKAFQNLLRDGRNPCEFYNKNLYNCLKQNSGSLISCSGEVERYQKCVFEAITNKLSGSYHTAEDSQILDNIDEMHLVEVQAKKGQNQNTKQTSEKPIVNDDPN